MFDPSNPSGNPLDQRRPVALLGVPIDNIDMPGVLDQVAEFIRTGRVTGKHYQIATANVDFLVKAQSDPELRYLLQTADLVTADGMPLVWAAQLLGHPLRGRVPGADLVPILAERAAREGHSIYLFGGGPGIPEKAAQILKARHPNLIIAGTCSPPFMSSIADMDPAILQAIRDAHPDILFVALGNPKQEKWIGMYGQSLHVPVLIGVGGSLDFLTATTKRAPAWVQQVGLEWIHRLVQDPKRLWRRYAVDIYVFGTLILRQLWTLRSRKQPAREPLSIEVLSAPGTATLAISGTLLADNISSFEETALRVLQTTSNIKLDLSKIEDLDSVAIGVMLDLARRAYVAGGHFSIIGVTEKVQHKLSILGVQTFLNVPGPKNNPASSSRENIDSSSANGSFQTIQENGCAWTLFKAPILLDTAAASRMKEECREIFTKNPRLIVDLSNTRFLLSGGLAGLKELSQTALENKGSLSVKGYTKELMPMLRAARLDQAVDESQAFVKHDPYFLNDKLEKKVL